MLYAIFAVLSIILDQWVKYWTDQTLDLGEVRTLIPGILDLRNVHNDGAAFSFLSGENAGSLFIILAIVFAILVVIGLITNFISGKLARWSAVFVAAGGIGNAIDRALYGSVQDMFQLSFLEDFPVFNVADIFITVFCLIFIICIIFGGKGKSESEDDIDYYEEEFEDVPKVRSSGSSRRGQDSFDEDEMPSRKRRQLDDFEEDDRPSRKRRQADDFEEDERPSRKRRQADEFEEEPKPRRSARKRDFDDIDDSAYPSGYESARSRRNRNAEFEEAFGRNTSSVPARRMEDETSKAAPRRKPASEDPFSEWDRINASSGYDRNASDASYRQEPSYSREPAPSYASVEPKPAPVTPERPAAPKKSSDDDFSLDDILAEFK